MVKSLLPPASNIIDLGGANGSIYDLGYPHKFKKLVAIDLPPENRCELYKDCNLEERVTPNGRIFVRFGNMVEVMSEFEENSIDFVWSGQSIEHIEEVESVVLFNEIRRVLKQDGYFCLDTPNRLITEMHTAWKGGGWVNPNIIRAI